MLRTRLYLVLIVALSLGAIACGLIGELEDLAEDFEDLAPGGGVGGELGGDVWQVVALTGAIIDTHQPCLLGGSEVFDLLLPGRGLQDAQVSAAVQHCEQEQPAGWGGQS